jgi:hypothetical protein
MLKKFLSLFFEEEEIIEEEAEETVVAPVKKPEVIKAEPKTLDPVKTVEKPAVKEELPMKKEKEFVDIKADGVEAAEYKPSIKKIDIDKGSDIEVKPIRRPAKPEPKPYEFSEVISPMFGRSEKEQPVKTVVQSMPVEESKSILGTIISPIYGVTKGRKQVTEVKQTAEIEHLTLEQMLGVEKSESFMQDSFDLIEDLDQPLVKEKPKTLISLFEEEEESQ